VTEPTPLPTDEELVAGMARGEQACLSDLYDRYAGLMLGVSVRMLRDRAEAQDLVHDVLLEAWGAADRYDRRRGTVKTWLMIRLRSRALDRVRSARISKRVDHDGTNLPEPKTAPPEDASGSPDRQRVQAVLAELPDAQRAVIELSYFGGLSGSEISEQLGVPLGTVKSRTAAALVKLRAALAEGGGS